MFVTASGHAITSPGVVMKKVFSFVFVPGLTMAIYGQRTIATAPTQVDCAPAPVLESKRLEVGMTNPAAFQEAGRRWEPGSWSRGASSESDRS
jgi:hypothetical protein